MAGLLAAALGVKTKLAVLQLVTPAQLKATPVMVTGTTSELVSTMS